MTQTLTVELPWPPTEARPNFIRSNHWSAYRRKIKIYRTSCMALTMAAMGRDLRFDHGPLRLSITFHPPKGCRWDRDAMSGAFKAGQDGIADAIKVDDALFTPHATYEAPGGAGRVVVRLEQAAAEKEVHL